jgi:Icc-related predicted phosphoesterase
VCPWWEGPAGRKAIAELLDAASSRRVGRWLWLYHAPPQGKLSWTGKRHYADVLLPELIAKHAPTAVFCGHIHEAPFESEGSWNERAGDTWLFNAGRQQGEVPARIELDFAQGSARWVTEGREEQCQL